MPNTKVSLDTAASTLDGTEKFHVVQGAADRAATALQQAELGFARLMRKRYTKTSGRATANWINDEACAHWHTANLTASGLSGLGPSTTNYVTRQVATSCNTAASAFALAYIRPGTGAQSLTIGAGSNVGGFNVVFRWYNRFAVSDQKFFAGLTNSTANPTNVEPDTLTNQIGVGKKSGSANLHIIYGGSAAQTAIDLGANFPAATAAVDLYEAQFFSDSNNSTQITYRIERNPGVSSNNFVATGTITNTTPGTTLPSTTTLLGPTMWICAGAAATISAFAFVSMACITDN